MVARLRTSRAGKFALRLLLAAVVASQVAVGPVQAEDIEPGPPGNGVVVTDSGLVLPVREAQEGGYRVTTPCWREGFVSSGTYLAGVDVVLDPGHGGSDYGAIGSNGLSEKDLNLAVAQMAATELRALGYSVLLTRTTDVRMPVVVRSEIARAVDPYVFVSIHHNGGAVRRSSNPGDRGPGHRSWHHPVPDHRQSRIRLQRHHHHIATAARRESRRMCQPTTGDRVTS